jgi:peptidoglycan/LPS O-acetylase OafA/YrhL
VQYRREIDGLRAVAVVPVILFHAGFGIFGGGFVGVDVFFVISGYLITGLILQDLERGAFSLTRFYERRARRILPALFLVMLCCLPFAWMWMSPSQAKNFAQSVVAVSLFVSNVLFWRESGYFDSASDEKPLLHTWSLAVEEQYYIIFPLLILVLWRIGGRAWTLACIAAISAASLAASELMAESRPTANFYLLPTRAWELLAGSICAFVQQRRGRGRNEALALIGLAAIVFSILVYDAGTPFPSLWALVPVGGTALIILFAEGTRTARLLSLRGFVGIGLISYSAYLWHQPLFAFARIRSPHEPEPWLMAGLAAAALALAGLSWRYVEQPFRGKAPLLPGRAPVFAASAAAAAAFVGFGVYGHQRDGIYPPVPAELRAEFRRSDWARRCLFNKRDGTVRFPVEACIFGDGPRKIAVLGDSLAASLAPAIIEKATAGGAQVHQLTHVNCLPARTLRRDHADAEPCERFVPEAIRYLNANDFDLVIVASAWSFVLGEAAFFDAPRMAGPGFGAAAAGPDFAAAAAADIEATLASIRAPVALVMPYAHHPGEVRDFAVEHYRRTGAMLDELTQPVEEFERGNALALRVLEAVDGPGIEKVDPAERLCGDRGCLLIEGGRPVLSDEMHFTRFGAERVVEPIYFGDSVCTADPLPGTVLR